MTTRYTQSNPLPAWRYCADLDAREALEQINAQRGLLSRKRFRQETVSAWRRRVGLAVEPVTKPKIAGFIGWLRSWDGLGVLWFAACVLIGAAFAVAF